MRDIELWSKRAFLQLVDAILVVAANGDVLYKNPAAESLLGALSTEPNVRGWVSSLSVNGSTVLCSYDDLPVIAGLSGVVQRVLTLAKPDGTGKRLEFHSSPLRDVDETVVASVSLVRDISAAYEEHAELVRARTFLDSIVENIPDMVFVKDAEYLRFDRFNRAGEELLGTPREEMLGKTDYDFFPHEQAEFFQKRDRQTLKEGKLVVIDEEPIDTRHGRRWLQTKKIPILDARGRPKYLLGISSDITARRNAEDALKRAHDELEQRVATRTAELRSAEEQLRHAQKMDAIGQLAGGVAHDFNNVLAVILAHGQLLRERVAENDPLRPGIDAITTAAEHAAALTRQLLAFSRRRALQPRSVDLRKVIADAQVMLTPLLGENVSLEVEAVGNLRRVYVDPSLMEQVIVNLAVNARDAMPRGGSLHLGACDIDVRASDLGELHGLEAGAHVLLTVQDTGMGMSKEVRARAFEPFFTTKEGAKGTGLGLAMVYGVITQSGGAIRLKSEVGHGTRVEIYLPEYTSRRTDPTDRAHTSEDIGGTQTVLLVEDQTPLRNVLREMLAGGGYTVLDAESGEQAIEIAARFDGEIHLLLTDVVMPGMSGAQLARSLNAARKDTRVLFMSGYASDRLASYALDTGMTYLQKPFTQQALFSAVREVLSGEALSTQRF